MKKMILGLAALAAGSVMAIESANIVGYQNLELGDAFNFVVNTFKPVGKTADAVTLSDIVPGGDATYGGTVIQLLDDGGATVMIDHKDLGEVYAEFYYVDSVVASRIGATAGWYLSSDDSLEFCQNDRIIPLGQGYMVENNDGEVHLTFSGEVMKDSIQIELGDAFNFTGNASPAAITLGDLTLGGDATYGGTVIQLLDDGGATVMIDHEDLGEVYAEFYYVDSVVASRIGATAGWYLSSDDSLEFCQNDRIILAGAGFMVENNDGEVAITIPSAL